MTREIFKNSGHGELANYIVDPESVYVNFFWIIYVQHLSPYNALICSFTDYLLLASN